MFPPPKETLAPMSADFESQPMIKATGFREYDARWLFPDEINLTGMQALGLGLGTLLHERNAAHIIVGHDFREYSQAVKLALINGLMTAGVRVVDIGLALSPTAYYAQFACDVPAVAMVTASHNENGWTGVKMGSGRPLTFGAEDMARLRDIVLGGEAKAQVGGTYEIVEDMAAQYKADLTNRAAIAKKLKAVVATGNGTAGIFAPPVLEALGVDVIPLHCELDYTFPHHNPNPEDIGMLHAVRDAVLASGADIGFAFDGDGDRCGVVDNQGREIFADKMGVLIARNLATQHKNAKFIVDVKSTGLFATDPELKSLGASTEYWKTGHSYMKRHTHETGALAGFEKSGHYFFNTPIGRGYDDGILAAIVICDLLAETGQTMATLHDSLPTTYASPTMSPFCADEIKYEVVERVIAQIKSRESFIGQAVKDITCVNGIRVMVEDGTWGLVRASSNKPSLVVVVESPTSQKNLEAMFEEIDAILSTHSEVGEYDQKLK